MPNRTMQNRKPIFVNGFSRGGTTILTNLLASHPDVCTMYEMHHAFKGNSITDPAWLVIRKCLLRDARILLASRQDFFSPRWIAPRRPLSPRLRQFVDRVIFKEKLRCRSSFFNRYKRRDVPYTRQEIENSRLVAKCIDGLIYATDELDAMYPDATFVGLVRNGLALCEGHLRRGRPADELGRRYRLLGEKMLQDADRLPRYKIFRFEDLMVDTTTFLTDLYQHAHLNLADLNDVRMQIRRILDEEGNHKLIGGVEWEVIWLDPGNLGTYFRRDVNRNQINRLSDADRDAFLAEAGETMERFGYDTGRVDARPQTIKFPDLEDGRRRAAA